MESIADKSETIVEARKNVQEMKFSKELVRFIMWNVEKRKTSYDLFNCMFEPAYTIEHIVNTMKKVTGLTQIVPYIPNAIIMPAAFCAQWVGSPMGICPARVKKLQISTNICGKKMKDSGYRFKWSFEEALADWFGDNNKKNLE